MGGRHAPECWTGMGRNPQMAWGTRRRLCLQRVELVFAKGTAWVIFQRVGNEDEIGKLTTRIPGRHQERMMGAF
jgi:hypothetical protein